MVPSMGTLSYFRDPFWDPSATLPSRWNEAGSTYIRGFGRFSRTHKQTDIKQTRTSYLGTGVADQRRPHTSGAKRQPDFSDVVLTVFEQLTKANKGNQTAQRKSRRTRYWTSPEMKLTIIHKLHLIDFIIA